MVCNGFLPASPCTACHPTISMHDPVNDPVNDCVNDWVIMVNDWVNDGLMMGYGFLKLIFFYVPLVYDQQYLYQVIEHDLLYLLLPCTLPATNFICRNLLLKNISKFTYTMYFCIQNVQFRTYQ